MSCEDLESLLFQLCHLCENSFEILTTFVFVLVLNEADSIWIDSKPSE